MRPSKILVIEDEKPIARFLELELTHEGYEVILASNGLSGLSYAELSNPDLILLDIMLPGLSGTEVCRQIRQFSAIPIIMLTAVSNTSDKVASLDLGANDYLTKPFEIEELLARIRVALRNTSSVAHTAKHYRCGQLYMDCAKHQVCRNDQQVDLTKTEYDLLEYLLINQGVVLTRVQILESVWGYDYAGDTNLVDVYIRYLRSKIEDPFNNERLIHTVRGVGYMIREA